MFKSYREESKKDYGITDDGNLRLDQLNCGSLLRIADACEKMCIDRENLERNCKDITSNRDYWKSYSKELERKIAALKGHITRLKNKK